MNEIKKDLYYTLVLIKEKEKNKHGIGTYDDTGEIDLKYIKEYWGETKEEVEERWLRSFSKQYFILWAPTIIFTFLGILFNKLMEVDMWYDHPITIITTVITCLSWSFSIFGAHERRKQARRIIYSLKDRKEKAERERREQQEKAERERREQQERKKELEK